MKSKTCIFIGGKQLGVNCLKTLLGSGIKPTLVIPNLDDDGIKPLWHESLTKTAQDANLNILAAKKVRDPETIAEIKKINPDIIFCFGGMQIIPKEVLDIPKLGTLNIHPALLPKYRGRFSTVHALFNGEKYTGVTLHYMSEALDAGPIIYQKKYKIEENDTGKTLYDKFTTAGTELFQKFLYNWLSDKKIKAKPQNEKEATYYPKGLPNNGEINWNWTGRQIKDFIRALTFPPFPPASFQIGDKKMIIVEEQ
jgi:methionyl-tRNA formyltransferase